MIHQRFLCGLAMAVSVAAAGCGSTGGSSTTSHGKSSTTSHVDFTTGFATSQQAFRKLGTDIAKDITGAGNKSDADLAQEFHGLATRADQQATQLAALQPPAKYRSRMTSLVSGFHGLKGDLSKIATAATDHDASSAETATRALLSDAAKIKAADTALSKALGLPPVQSASSTSTSSSVSATSSGSG